MVANVMDFLYFSWEYRDFISLRTLRAICAAESARAEMDMPAAHPVRGYTPCRPYLGVSSRGKESRTLP
eukprot:scaffold141_cov410-Prasinococcus_capsulatus_cf.AAC.14